MTSQFWSMGGYARFVWPCVAFAIVVLAWNLWSARRYYAKAQRRAERAFAVAAIDRAASEGA